MKRNKKQQGFSLIELLIVVAIILIIAAIAIPKLLQARATSQEAAAAGSTRTVNTALAAFNSKFDAFPADMGVLGGVCDTTNPPIPTRGCQLDDSLATTMNGGGKVNGYIFTYTMNNAGAGYTLKADPAPGSAATKHYFSTDSTIHYNITGPATATDPSLGQ